jgi:hypothetical protein
LGAFPYRSLADGVQDAAGEPQTGKDVHLRLVPSPSALVDRGAARRAQYTRARSFQLLRRQRQLSEFAAARRGDEAGLVQVAVPSQPAQAAQLGEILGPSPTMPSPPPTDHGPDLGCVTTSHIDRRAGWRKSPSPDLARGRGGQPPGLLYNGLLTPPCQRRPPQPPPPAAPLCARLFRAAQRAAAASPERPGARRSPALHGAGWCWTGAAGWGRVARRDALE